MLHKTFSLCSLFAVVVLVSLGCGKQLSQVGDDCNADADCASGLCDTNGSCADPVDTTDGKPCTTDATCPTGDNCDASTGKCFSPAKDGTGGGASCTSDSDCAGDETCNTGTGKCQG